jgi:hypothetical protein
MPVAMTAGLLQRPVAVQSLDQARRHGGPPTLVTAPEDGPTHALPSAAGSDAYTGAAPLLAALDQAWPTTSTAAPAMVAPLARAAADSFTTAEVQPVGTTTTVTITPGPTALLSRAATPAASAAAAATAPSIVEASAAASPAAGSGHGGADVATDELYEHIVERLRRDLLFERERMGDLLGDLP